MLHALHYDPTTASDDHAAAVVGSYAFSATLAIQDITGLADSGLTASHMAKRLEGSAESDAHLFALTQATHPRPVGSFGYPEITDADLTHIDAWVFISLPKLEDTDVLEATITLDAAIAPLPGEPLPHKPWQSALSLIDDLSHSLARPIRQVWVTSPDATSTSSEEQVHDDEQTSPTQFLRDAGYATAYEEEQVTFNLDAVEPDSTARHPEGSITIVRNMDFAPEDIPSLRDLLTASSKDYPRGSLKLDHVEWTEQRLRDAGARLLDRGGNQLTALVRTRSNDIVGMAEAVHYDSDADSLMELGLVYVLPQHRQQGHATKLLEVLLAAAKAEWPELTTGYSSHPADSEPAARILEHYAPQTISFATAWQRLPDSSPNSH